MIGLVQLPDRGAPPTVARAEAIQMTMLVLAYDAGGAIPFAELWKAMPATRNEIFTAIRAQFTLGNVKRHHNGEAITLTASARAAIAAGRAIMTVAQEMAA